MKKIEVKFSESKKLFTYYDNDIELKLEDNIVTDSNGMLVLGIVKNIIEGDAGSCPKIKTILRKATPKDIAIVDKFEKTKTETMKKAQEIASKEKLQLKINDMVVSADNKIYKIIYTASDRVDFRNYIKVVAKTFGKRINMLQINNREKASKVCGIGVCGRELCCCKVLKKLPSVKVTTLKIQNIAISPDANEGMCGKLKCCYNYEEETYKDMLSEFPEQNKIVTHEKKQYKVIGVNFFSKMVKLMDKERAIIEVNVDTVEWSNN